MKNLRKISAIFIALAMVLSVISSLSGLKVSADEHKTTLVIHKIVMPKNKMNAHKDNEDRQDGKKYTGAKITDMSYFDGGTEVAGVAFDIYKRIDTNETGSLANNDLIFGGKAAADSDKFFKKVQGPLLTTATGVDVPNLVDGVYMIVENKAASTYSSADKKILSEAKAVPARIELPLTKPDGSGLFGTADADKLHLYPKNTEEKPEIDKTVGDLVNKYQSTEVGKKVTWYLQLTAPTDIKNYKVLKLSDTFSNSLTYQTGSVVVKYGSGTTFDAATYQTLVKDTDYEVDETVNNAVTIKLKEAGIAKLSAGDKVIASVDTVINDKAIMGKDIPNDGYTIEYGHKPGNDGTKDKLPREKEPKVVTGGKKFKKVVEGTETALEDAVFELHDDATVVNWSDALIAANKEAIDAGKFAIKNGSAYEATSAAKQPTAGQPIYLRSIADGTFEIKGLEYSSWQKQKWDTATNSIVNDGSPITHKWNIVEVKAPNGYALNSTAVEFTVNVNSYFVDPTIASTVAADPLKVNNKKVTIPQTGGIGTVIFAVVGLGLMGFAAYAMKRNSKED
nr:SpaH/EbpB family LPXTG-anchored major pilin [uncultured Peptostreptococcus sp.]